MSVPLDWSRQCSANRTRIGAFKSRAKTRPPPSHDLRRRLAPRYAVDPQGVRVHRAGATVASREQRFAQTPARAPGPTVRRCRDAVARIDPPCLEGVVPSLVATWPPWRADLTYSRSTSRPAPRRLSFQFFNKTREHPRHPRPRLPARSAHGRRLYCRSAIADGPRRTLRAHEAHLAGIARTRAWPCLQLQGADVYEVLGIGTCRRGAGAAARARGLLGAVRHVHAARERVGPDTILDDALAAGIRPRHAHAMVS